MPSLCASAAFLGSWGIQAGEKLGWQHRPYAELKVPSVTCLWWWLPREFSFGFIVLNCLVIFECKPEQIEGMSLNLFLLI